MKYSQLIKLAFVFNLVASTLVIANPNHINTVSQQKSNIIMVIADGMGPAYITAHRYLNNMSRTTQLTPVTNTVFDRHLVGAASTFPHHMSMESSGVKSEWLTDSAASATAMASGIKTYNTAIGVDINKQPVLTVASQAKQQGKKVGLVVTSPITDATPAAYFTHHESRKSYNAIADSYLALLNEKKLDIALGGGTRYFLRDDQNLVKTLTSQGGHYIDNYQQLATIPKDKSVLGLFAEVELPKAIDDVNPQRLLNMTQAAIKHLENEQGYFLLVEASQVDWAGHDKDIVGAMSEMQELDNTLTWLEGYVDSHPNTTVVITADHSTGGLTLSSNYQAWDPSLIRQLKQSPYAMAQYYVDTKIVDDKFKLGLSTKDIEALIAIKRNGTEQKLSKDKTHALIFANLIAFINDKTHTGWTTYGHTAVDVPLMAMGKNSELFRGMQDNTDIAKKIFSLLAVE